MPIKRAYGSVSSLRLSPLPKGKKAKSLSIRLRFDRPPAEIDFELTADGAMILMQQLQTLQQRYGWRMPVVRVLRRRDMH